MQQLAILLTVLLLALTSNAQQPTPAAFIKATLPFTWDDGLFTSPGSVDLLAGETQDSFIIITTDGKRYSLPKTHAVRISANEAAVLLIAERAQKDARIAVLVDQLQGPAQTSQPSNSQLYRKPASGSVNQQTREQADQWWQNEQQRQELRGIRKSVENLKK